MITTTVGTRAKKARLDNRWGCCVGHAFRNFNRHPVSAPPPAPVVPALDRSPNFSAAHQAMKTTILMIASAVALAVGVLAEPKSQSATSAPTPQESATLADACRLTQLMNEDKWNDVEKALGTKDGMVAILRQHATLKDWPGIGAYRGTRVDEKSPLRITHRFGFSPKTNPHEIWLSYIIQDSGPSKPSLMVLGW